MTRSIVAAVIVLTVALPARAETWIWTDEEGGERWTDAPESVPPECKNTLRKAEFDEEGDATLSIVDPSNEAPPPPTAADQRARVARIEQRRRLQSEQTTLEGEVRRLRKELSRASNEHRRYRAGGRIGAAEKAVAAEKRAAALARELEDRERELEGVKGRLGLLADER